MKEAPEILNAIVDKVLAYRLKPKSKGAKKRKRKQTALEKKKDKTLLTDGFLLEIKMSNRRCGTSGCKELAIGIVGKREYGKR
jgi:hypothetical protein